MPRPHTARSDSSDQDVDGNVEQQHELQRLERQYRIMENDRKAYTYESQAQIKKQTDEMEKLAKEKKELLVYLRLLESRSNQTRDEANSDKIADLGNEKLDLENQQEEERKKQEELQAQIREWRAKIREQSKNMGGINMSQQHNVGTQKKISKLENQLLMHNKKFSDALEDNKKLREEIDSLRVERLRFENLHSKLEKELEQLKRDTGEVIEQATSAYDARDEAQAKMILLKEKSDKDIQQHCAEMKELIRIIDHDRKLKEFMATKGKERLEDQQLVIWRQRKEEREAEKKKESQVDSVETYEAAFERIKEITGEEDIDVLVNHFIMVEDGNFALFNYVNELNSEIESLQEQIYEIRLDMDRFQSQGMETEAERKAILKQLEEQQLTASKTADENDENFKGVMKILDQLRAGIESLFSKISCDRSAIDDMLGAQAGVSEQNMIQYLGIVEERTNQLLLIQAYTLKQKDFEIEYSKRQPSLLGEGPEATAQPPHIHPPTVGDEYEQSEGSDASDDDGRPFTRVELQRKVMKTVKKRESAARKEGFKYDLSDAREKAKTSKMSQSKGGKR